MQLAFPPQIEAFVQRQLASGKYANLLELILAALELLRQQEDIYGGRLQELQQEALVGWEASQRGEVVEASIALSQIRAGLQERYGDA
ncbi:MAG: type II toxin-antitoxin system ParD family antitoxin [Prochlorothrix sp.]